VLSRPYEPEMAMTWRVIGDDWTGFDVGSVVHVEAPTAFLSGYSGDVRLVAVQPHEEAGELNLVVELLEGHDG